MADTEFSNLPATNTIAATDQLLVGRNGAAYRFSGSLPTVAADGTVGTARGITTATFIPDARNPIWRFGNADAFGLSYFQGAAGSGGLDAVGVHFGTATFAGSVLVIMQAGGIRVGGVVRSAADGSDPLGTAANRWSEVRAVNGTILTSDEREKHWRGELSEAHLRAARRIVREIGLFQWHDAIVDKGDDGARLHIGPRAQAVMQIMVDEGLEVPFEGDGLVPHFRHAFLCYDRWAEEPAVTEVRGEDDQIVTAAQPGRPAGDRFGLRIDQLTMFLLAALLGEGFER